MKKILALAILFCSLTAMAANGFINEKVLKTFNQVFKNAEDVQWNSTADYSVANFTINSIITRAKLDNNGVLIETVRYYKEDHLPSNILFKIKKKYKDCSVWGVTEVSNAQSTMYYVVLKNETHIYNLKSDTYGNLERISKLERADI